MLNRIELRSLTRRFAVVPALGLSIAALGACEGLLDVELPGDMTEADLLDPQSAEMMVHSSIADFECSFSMYTAQIAGLEDARHQTSGYWSALTRYNAERPGTGSCPNNAPTGTNWFSGFQSSRLMAETAYQKISEWGADQVEEREQLLATAATYAGLFYQIFGEVYCEFSPATGELLTPAQMLRRSEEWFTTALQHIGSGDYAIISTPSLKQLALLGRARVRFALGEYDGARADAAQIEPGFTAWATRDATVRGRWNAVHRGMSVEQWGSIAPAVTWIGGTEEVVSLGYQNLTIAPDGRHTVNDGVPDPRVPVEYIGQFAQDGVTDQWIQLKYTSLDDDQPIARWAEAQLILAEIEGGQSAVDRINALRDVHGLPHYQGGTSPAEIRELIIEERRREFFFEGRFYADKLRYDLWFPRGVGRNHKSQAYGVAYCLLMPEDEYRINPNIPAGYVGPDLSNPAYRFSTRE